jgi:hypothetical protein
MRKTTIPGLFADDLAVGLFTGIAYIEGLTRL